MRRTTLNLSDSVLGNLWLSTADAARFLGCSEATIRRLVRRSLLQPDAVGRRSALAFRYSTVARYALNAGIANEAPRTAESVHIGDGRIDGLPRDDANNDSVEPLGDRPYESMVKAMERAP